MRMKPGPDKNSGRMLMLLAVCACAVTAGLAGPDHPSVQTPEPTAKIIRQYALTSANDFPQRDPQDWRLLGSNDGGKTWTVLDVRAGETFSERHQRRVFTLGDASTAYSLFRLEIDRVHDPITGKGVQLAEIEPMGSLEDGVGPVPLFCDVITAQGENPPMETARKAFDDHVETKWFDPASDNPTTRSSWIQWQYVARAGLVITNTSQLLSLGTQANGAFQVRIEGVLIGQISGTNRVCVMDANGYVEAGISGPGFKLPPGQRIILEGQSHWNNNAVEVTGGQIQAVGPKAPEEPASIQPEQPIVPGQELQWVQAEGQVQFLTHSDGTASFELSRGGHDLSVHILHLDPALPLPAPGARVRVRGLCGGLLNQNTDLVAANLWVPGADAVTLVAPANTVTGAHEEEGRQIPDVGKDQVITRIDQIRSIKPDDLGRRPKVKIRGVVTEFFCSCVQDATGGVEVWLDDKTQPQSQPLGSYVEIEGVAVKAVGHGVAGYGPVLQAEKIRFLGAGKLPNPVRPSWSLLTSGEMDAQWVEVEAVVRATDGSHLLLSGDSGQLMATIRSAPVSEVNRLVDATIRIRGVCFIATDDRSQMQGIQILVPSMDYVEVRQPPATGFTMKARKINTLYQLRGPKETVHRVKIEGVVTYVGNNNYFIQDDSGSVKAIGKQNVTLNLPSWGWWAFWQNEKTDVTSQEMINVKVGDWVEALGFAETRGYAPVLSEAELRVVGQNSPVKAAKTTVNELAQGKLDAALVTLDGLFLGGESLGSLYVLHIQSEGKVFEAFLPLTDQDPPNLPAGSHVRVAGVCQMESTTREALGKSPSTFSILLRNSADILLLERPPWLTVKRTLLAVGVLVVVLLVALIWIRLLRRRVEARTHQLKQEIAGHERTEELLASKTRLLQREIEEHERTAATVAEQTGLLEEEIKERKLIYAELEEKKASLEREIEERKRAQAEIDQIHKRLLTTSRMAGMADVATNVLHNVGNVLNSVNVLAASLVTQVQDSRIPGVARLAALLGQHSTDLGSFVTEDANGRLVPGHLDRLGRHLAQEQSKLLEKTESLTESINHIKEIIAVQQNYARAGGETETVALAEVVEDALKMCSGGLTRHDIKVVRDFEETPPVTLDRHKVLQILFNLLDNAKHACQECNGTQSQVTIRIRNRPDERVRLEVLDNGIGISKENLGRIFTQGFSTRKGGHGFGLHSSILAAQDMGGSLSVSSNGPGSGSTFTLEMPLAVNGDSEKTEMVFKS
jgi:signal transduction histidine kinase